MTLVSLAVLSCLLVSGVSLAPGSLTEEQCVSNTQCSDTTSSLLQTHSSVQRQGDSVATLLDAHNDIPRKIVQSYRTPLGSLPTAMEHARLTWEKLNPEFEYKFFTDDDMKIYVDKEGRWLPGLTEAFDALTMPAERADIFRFLFLYNEGGVWSDIDMILRKPLREVLRPEDQLVVRSGGRGILEGEWVAAAPHHPVLKHVLERAIGEVKSLTILGNGTCLDCSLYPLKIAGPFQLTRSATDLLFPELAKSLPPSSFYWPKGLFKPGLYEDPEKAVRLRVHSLRGDETDMTMKYDGYSEDIKSTGNTYWKDQRALDAARRLARLANAKAKSGSTELR